MYGLLILPCILHVASSLFRCPFQNVSGALYFGSDVTQFLAQEIKSLISATAFQLFTTWPLIPWLILQSRGSVNWPPVFGGSWCQTEGRVHYRHTWSLDRKWNVEASCLCWLEDMKMRSSLLDMMKCLVNNSVWMIMNIILYTCFFVATSFKMKKKWPAALLDTFGLRPGPGNPMQWRPSGKWPCVMDGISVNSSWLGFCLHFFVPKLDPS